MIEKALACLRDLHLINEGTFDLATAHFLLNVTTPLVDLPS
jgi:hypothetical protein